MGACVTHHPTYTTLQAGCKGRPIVDSHTSSLQRFSGINGMSEQPPMMRYPSSHPTCHADNGRSEEGIPQQLVAKPTGHLLKRKQDTSHWTAESGSHTYMQQQKCTRTTEGSADTAPRPVHDLVG